LSITVSGKDYTISCRGNRVFRKNKTRLLSAYNYITDITFEQRVDNYLQQIKETGFISYYSFNREKEKMIIDFDKKIGIIKNEKFNLDKDSFSLLSGSLSNAVGLFRTITLSRNKNISFSIFDDDDIILPLLAELGQHKIYFEIIKPYYNYNKDKKDCISLEDLFLNQFGDEKWYLIDDRDLTLVKDRTGVLMYREVPNDAKPYTGKVSGLEKINYMFSDKIELLYYDGEILDGDISNKWIYRYQNGHRHSEGYYKHNERGKTDKWIYFNKRGIPSNIKLH